MMTLKAKIIGHDTQANNKIAYVVEVQDGMVQRNKISKLRYSEFKEIN